MARRGIWSKGDVFIRRWVNGVLSDDVITVEGIKLEFQLTSELVERIGKGIGNWGETIGSVAKKGSTDVTLGFQEVDASLMAIVLLGTDTALNIAGGTEAGESITVKHDEWVKVSEKNISVSAITASVLGTDFLEHNRLGMIKALSTGNIVDGASVSVGYTFGAITGRRINAGTEAQIDVEINFVGEWVEDGTQTDVRIPKITLTPASPFDLLPDEYVSPEFAGKAIKLASESGSIIFDNDVVNA